MRKRRNAVPSAARRIASWRVARHLLTRRLLSFGQRVAIYAPFDGEIDLAPVLRCARRLKLRLYAPRIVNMRARKMEFVELGGARGCSPTNRRLHWLLGPRDNLHRRIDPRELDVVLIPVVAFDAHGWRLGFGAGFYDRKLAFMRRSSVRTPLLIGIGYEFQRVPAQPSSPWDVPLHCVVTERGVHRVHRHVSSSI